MHFVKNDKLVLMARKVQFGVRQPGAIRIGFKVEINRRPLIPDHAR